MNTIDNVHESIICCRIPFHKILLSFFSSQETLKCKFIDFIDLFCSMFVGFQGDDPVELVG